MRVAAISALFLVVSVFASSPMIHAQQPAATMDALKFLLGNWVGEGSAETGQPGAGSCSFELGLQDKVIVRTNHAQYPPSEGRPAIVHDDLMIIYLDQARHQLRAFYTDNEGHVIHYTVLPAPDGKNVMFLGDVDPGSRRYRLSYTIAQPDHMTIQFEMAPPDKPDQFQKFIEGRLRKSGK